MGHSGGNLGVMQNFENKLARVIAVTPSGEVLLNRRPAWSKQAAGKLQILGGKFEKIDTTRKHAAIREILEELGLKLFVRDVLFMCASENNGWITFAFICLLDNEYDPGQMPDHGEFDKLELVPISQIAELIGTGDIAFDHPELLNTFLKVIGK